MLSHLMVTIPLFTGPCYCHPRFTDTEIRGHKGPLRMGKARLLTTTARSSWVCGCDGFTLRISKMVHCGRAYVSFVLAVQVLKTTWFFSGTTAEVQSPVRSVAIRQRETPGAGCGHVFRRPASEDGSAADGGGCRPSSHLPQGYSTECNKESRLCTEVSCETVTEENQRGYFANHAVLISWLS